MISVLPTYPFCILLYSKSNTCFQEELEAACGTGSRTADAARLSVRSVRREDFASGDLSPSTLLVSFLSPAQEACKGLNIFAPLPTKEFFGLLAAVCVLEHLPTDFWTENIRQATESLLRRICWDVAMSGDRGRILAWWAPACHTRGVSKPHLGKSFSLSTNTTVFLYRHKCRFIFPILALILLQFLMKTAQPSQLYSPWRKKSRGARRGPWRWEFCKRWLLQRVSLGRLRHRS